MISDDVCLNTGMCAFSLHGGNTMLIEGIDKSIGYLQNNVLLHNPPTYLC